MGPECVCPPPYPMVPTMQPGTPQVHVYKCPQDRASGVLCHAHFERGDTRKWEQAGCEACRQADQEHKDRIQRDHTIDPAQPYGAHIALTCRNHPELRWHTKNIDHIGARKVFFPGVMRGVVECPCPMGYLTVVKEGGSDEPTR